MSQADSTLEHKLTVQLPSADQVALGQDAEWCIVEHQGEQRRIRFHDYAEIFAIPGLYERLFYTELKCESPRTVRDLLAQAIEERAVNPADLTVLDVGAGNGMVGEELAELGVGSLVGVDILQAAADATHRDRPDVYDHYRVVDLTDVPAADDQFFREAGFNALASVAALGFGDIPPRAFAQAYNYLRPRGFFAFTIKEDFVTDTDPTGFHLLIRRMFDEGVVGAPIARHRYRHRFSVAGTPLYYLAYVVEKVTDIPDAWLD